MALHAPFPVPIVLSTAYRGNLDGHGASWGHWILGIGTLSASPGACGGPNDARRLGVFDRERDGPACPASNLECPARRCPRMSGIPTRTVFAKWDTDGTQSKVTRTLHKVPPSVHPNGKSHQDPGRPSSSARRPTRASMLSPAQSSKQPPS